MRFAIVGMGNMGRKYAKMLYNGKVYDAKLTAVVCRNESAREWSQKEIPGVKVYDRYEKMLEQKDNFDAVLIVTPHKTHPDMAIKAFKAGKAVFCDKPAGISAGEAELMTQTANATGQLYAMMFHQRLYDKYIRIKSIIESKELGDILRVMVINSRYYRTEYYHKSSSWRSSWNGEGGGALINQGQHIVDIWQWLFGMPESIYADIKFGKYNEFTVDDEAVIMMKYKNNVSGVFVLTTGEIAWEEKLEISMTKGKIILEDHKLTVVKYGEDTYVYSKTATCNAREQITLSEEVTEFEQKEEPYVKMLQNFVNANKGETPLVAPGSAGRNALEIVNAAYLSSWLGKEIKLPVNTKEYECELSKHMELLESYMRFTEI